MNKNEIVKLREIQVDERDVPAKYIKAFNSYLDDVVIPHFEKQLEKKDKEIETLRFTIDEMSNANKNIHKAFEVFDKNNRHQICEEIREKVEKAIWDENGENYRNDGQLYLYYGCDDIEEFDLDKIIDQIENKEQGDEE